MPQSITTGNGTSVNYGYLSDGTKYRAVSDSGEKYLYAGSLRFRIDNNNVVPESFDIAGGRVTYNDGSWQTNYYITDHLGSVRAVTDANGNVLAEFDYTPYGELLTATDNTATGTDRLFTGKEQQGKLGISELYDSQARFMNTTGRFLSMDPLAEKYYHLSPYAYCAGDPVNLVDPDGRKIHPKSMKRWEKQLKRITKRRDKLQNELSSDETSKNVEDLQTLLKSLNETLNTMQQIEESSQVYCLKVSNVEYGYLKLDVNTKIINIYYTSTDNLVHEITHAGQFESGDLAFSSINGNVYAQDIHDEVAAYKAQYAYKIFDNRINYNDITAEYVQSIKDANGDYPYGYNGRFNTGISTVNINSDKVQLLEAYPWNANVISMFPPEYRLRFNNNVYYKE